MRVRAYSAYRQSGVEWVGLLPESWSLTALKHVVAMQSGEQITAERIEVEGTFPVYGGNGLRGFTEAFTHEGHYALIGRQGALCGNVNFASGRFWASEHAVVCTPKGVHDVRWLGGLLGAMELGQYSVTAAQPGLSVEAIGNLRVPVPPRSDQVAIGSFLDSETGKIDALVGEQERLIALLKEKRQAVISQAVTKGLDPTVPMKHSGVEWLGEVPAHWKVLRCGYYVQIFPGYAFPSDGFSTDNFGARLLRGINVGVGTVRWDETVYWQREPNDGLERFELAEGDIVLGMDRPWISDGVRVARIQADDLPCLLLQRVARITTG